MNNWKTTLGGALLALAPVIETTISEPWAYWVAQFCKVAGAAILGGAAADTHKK